MKLNTIIKMPDGRIGTICWNHLDGEGGVWGEHHFEVEESFSDDLPAPEFMLREKEVEKLLQKSHGDLGGNYNLECVGKDYEIIQVGE